MSMLANSKIEQRELRLVTYADAILEATIEAMESDPRVFLFGLDVDDHKAILGSTLGLQERFGKHRVFSTPLSEDAMTGIAIGAAMAGFRPIHVHIRMDFLLLCMNQLINIAAKAHYMYGGTVSVPLVVRTIIGRSWGQGAQHSQALHALFMHIPGLKVIAPSNATDAKIYLKAAINDNNPVIFIEHRLLYGLTSYLPQLEVVPVIGKASIKQKGNDVTIVSVSYMVIEALRAAKALQKLGISAEIIDLISLCPLDIETVLQSAKKTGKLLIVDNGWLPCGLSAEVMAKVIEYCQKHQERIPKMSRLGFAHTTCPTTKPLENIFYPNCHDIILAARHLIDDKTIFSVEKQLALEVENFKGPF